MSHKCRGSESLPLIGNSHDQVAKLFRVQATNFEHTYLDKSEEMKRALLEYVKTLRAIGSTLNAGTGTGAGIHTNITTGQLHIQLNPKGFPIAPCPDSWEKISKDNIEQLYRSYMTLHYSKLFICGAI